MRIPPLTGLPPLRGYPQHSPTQWPSDSALESTLLSVLSALEAEMVFIRNLVGGLLAELEDDIDHDRFKRLLHYSRRLASFQNRAKLVCMQWPSLPSVDLTVLCVSRYRSRRR